MSDVFIPAIGRYAKLASSPYDIDQVTAAQKVAGQGGTSQPSWSGPLNPGTVVSATAAENVVDSRLIPAGGLQPNDIVEGTIQLFVPNGATNGVKNIRVCVDADTSNSLLVALAADQVGRVMLRVRFLVNAASPHLIDTAAALNAQAFDQAHGNVAVDLTANPIHLQTRAWVANAADSVNLESTNWRLLRSGL